MVAPAERSKDTSRPPGAGHKVVGLGSDAAQVQAFAQLMRIESEARRARSTRELDLIVVNDSQPMLRSRQVFLIECTGRPCRVSAASSLVTVDQASPMVRWVAATVSRLRDEKGLRNQIEFSLPGYAPAEDALTGQYPFRNVFWQPLWSPDGTCRAGMLCFREATWLEAERSIANRLGETFGHARALLTSAGGRPTASRSKRLLMLATAVAVAAVGAIPVPISVLAPLEVVPRTADVVAMPFEGIVQQVLVKPNASVGAGTPLVRLVDTVQRNRAEIAAREVEVAAARVEKATSLAFTDPRGREELGIARAELTLKQAEYTYARELLGQTVIKAERPGIAVFSDPRELEGRPLSTGDRLMLVAKPGEMEFKISLPVADSIVLQPGLPVKGFLDSDPLNPAAAKIATIDRHVRVDERQIASYRITARLDDDSTAATLGARGTAQIQGERAPLVLYLLRRPLTALRQWIGL